MMLPIGDAVCSGVSCLILSSSPTFTVKRASVNDGSFTTCAHRSPCRDWNSSVAVKASSDHVSYAAHRMNHIFALNFLHHNIRRSIQTEFLAWGHNEYRIEAQASLPLSETQTILHTPLSRPTSVG